MGAEFGTVVHAVFEAVDAAGPDLPGQLRQACAAALSRVPAGELTSDELAAAMLPSFQTPLGPLAGDRRLSDIPPSDLLAELGFEFPLAGGDRPTAVVTLGMVAPLLRRHLAGGRSAPSLSRADRPSRARRAVAARISQRQHRRGAPGRRADR